MAVDAGRACVCEYIMRVAVGGSVRMAPYFDAEFCAKQPQTRKKCGSGNQTKHTRPRRPARACGGSSAELCGGLTVRYPFGFSAGCKIPLGYCDPADGTAWVGHGRELGLRLRNVTERALVVELRPDCSRRLGDSLRALFSSGTFARRERVQLHRAGGRHRLQHPAGELPRRLVALRPSAAAASQRRPPFLERDGDGAARQGVQGAGVRGELLPVAGAGAFARRAGPGVVGAAARPTRTARRSPRRRGSRGSAATASRATAPVAGEVSQYNAASALGHS
jgi:hypothetical protein